MSEADEWNKAYIAGALRRKRDFDYIIPSDTPPVTRDEIEYESRVIVGGLIVMCLMIVGGLMLAGCLS